MIPVLGSAELCAADAQALRSEPTSSLDLMERAAVACAKRIRACLNHGTQSVWVVAGMGNNGGDGLAIARLLALEGIEVNVLRIVHRDQTSADNATNHRRLLEAGVRVFDVHSVNQWPAIPERALVIDALFGIGLNAPLSGLAADIVEAMNRSNCPIISIDLPSGLQADGNREGLGIVKAQRTLTIEVPKLALLLPENEVFVGEWEAVPIGLDGDFLRGLPTSFRIAEVLDAAMLLPQRGRFAHKGRFGHALIVAGQEGRIGAAILATRACCRSGSGLTTAHIPHAGLNPMQVAVPEAMCVVDANAAHLTQLGELNGYKAIGCGPGLGTAGDTRIALRDLIERWAGPLVLDADALNILSSDRELIKNARHDWVLTPHPKEFDRLAAREFACGRDRLAHAIHLAQEWGCHMVLKGAWSAICAPDGSVVFNPTGGPGMAKGGSGDALTGVLTALLAQGLGPMQACLLGTYAHGLAGDIAADRFGIDGMLTSDLIDALPAAWQRLRAESAQHA